MTAFNGVKLLVHWMSTVGLTPLRPLVSEYATPFRQTNRSRNVHYDGRHQCQVDLQGARLIRAVRLRVIGTVHAGAV
eukprot:2545183-Pyramimonas_sp.AAC.1